MPLHWGFRFRFQPVMIWPPLKKCPGVTAKSSEVPISMRYNDSEFKQALTRIKSLKLKKLLLEEAKIKKLLF